MQEVQQIVRVLSRGIEAHDEVDGAVALDDLFESLPEAGIALSRLGELEFRRGRLQIVAQESRIVPLA